MHIAPIPASTSSQVSAGSSVCSVNQFIMRCWNLVGQMASNRPRPPTRTRPRSFRSESNGSVGAMNRPKDSAPILCHHSPVPSIHSSSLRPSRRLLRTTHRKVVRTLRVRSSPHKEPSSPLFRRPILPRQASGIASPRQARSAATTVAVGASPRNTASPAFDIPMHIAPIPASTSSHPSPGSSVCSVNHSIMQKALGRNFESQILLTFF